MEFNRQQNTSNALKLNGYYYGRLMDLNNGNTNIYVLFENGVFANLNSHDSVSAAQGNVDLSLPELAY